MTEGFKKPRWRVAAYSAYDAGGNSDLDYAWRDQAISGNSAIISELKNLRSRSRDAYRNTFVRNGINVFVDSVLGHGVQPSLTNLPEDFIVSIQNAWKTFSKNCDADYIADFNGMLRLSLIETMVAGEALFRFRDRRPSDGFEIPLQRQLLSGDFLPVEKNEIRGPVMVMAGIQYSPIGRPEVYFLYNQDPNDAYSNKINSMTPLEVPASAIVHLRLLNFAGQRRGEPALAPVLRKIRFLHEYDQATLIKRRASASITGAIEAPLDGSASNIAEAFESQSMVFKPGMILSGAPGEKFNFVTISDTENYVEFSRAQKQDIAAALGVPYELLSQDFTATSDRTFRSNVYQFKNRVESFRWNVLVPTVLNPIFQRFLTTAALAGALGEMEVNVEEIMNNLEWSFPPIGHLHDKAAIDAYKAAIDAKLMPRSYAIRELGFDPAVVDAEAEADAARFGPSKSGEG
jgi:lambda family phage portal protein